MIEYLKYSNILLTSISNQQPSSPKPVVTGNWGCGSLKGDPQLKGKHW